MCRGGTIGYGVKGVKHMVSLCFFRTLKPRHSIMLDHFEQQRFFFQDLGAPKNYSLGDWSTMNSFQDHPRKQNKFQINGNCSLKRHWSITPSRKSSTSCRNIWLILHGWYALKWDQPLLISVPSEDKEQQCTTHFKRLVQMNNPSISSPLTRW